MALHKIVLLKRFTNSFRVIAPDILPEIKQIQGVEYVEKVYEPDDLKGFRLVYITTDKTDLNQQIADHAKALGCLVNVADNPSCSDFVSPAIYVDRHMTVAVGSDGKDVLASVKLRDKLKLWLSEN